MEILLTHLSNQISSEKLYIFSAFFFWMAVNTCWPNQWTKLLSEHLQQLQRESRARSLTHQYPYPILHITHPISLGPWHVHCRMCLHLLLLCFIDESRKPKLMMPRCPRSRPCGVARSTVELPCCSRCCRRQMAKIYSKLRRSCIL